MIVLGVDPGTVTTGYGVVRGDARTPELVECGVVRPTANGSLSRRLAEIYEGIAELLEKHKPDILAVEQAFHSKNVRTTLVLGHARGVILLAGERAQVQIEEYSPTMIKKAVVGSGNATKEQVQFMAARLLRLRSTPSPADAADGVAAALTCVLGSALRRRLGDLNSAANGRIATR